MLILLQFFLLIIAYLKWKCCSSSFNNKITQISCSGMNSAHWDDSKTVLIAFIAVDAAELQQISKSGVSISSIVKIGWYTWFPEQWQWFKRFWKGGLIWVLSADFLCQTDRQTAWMWFWSAVWWNLHCSVF